MERRFSYRAKRVNIVLSFILGIPMVAIAVYSLATGSLLARRGTVFSPEVSLIIFIGILLAGAGLLVFGIRLAAAGRREVVVTPEQIVLPASVGSKRIETVPLDAIHNLVLQNDQVHGRVLTLVLHDRKPLRLAKSAFDNAQAFEDCHAAIDTVLRAKHG